MKTIMVLNKRQSSALLPLTQKGERGCRTWALFFLLNAFVAYGNTLEVIRKIPHSGYSEGLDFYDGFLWHALPTAILKIDPKDGTVLERYLPATKYSESLAWLGGVLWNVSFSDNGLYRGSLSRGILAFEKKGTVPEVHAWGLTVIEKQLVFTGDYSNKLYFWDPKQAKVVKTLETEGKDLEDLAFDGKIIWTSSFTQHKGHIFGIHPKTGKLTGLYPLPKPEECPVIDGIAYDEKGLWITGKECASIFYVRVPKVK